MEIDPDAAGSLYRTLAGAVIPRPIAWVSSVSSESTRNLAPYSFFNVVSIDPPVVMFAPGANADRKDTARNVRETGECVVNVVTEGFAEAMNASSATLPPDESEFAPADVEPTPSATVSPPRVAGVAVAFECERYEVLDVGTAAMVLAEVVHVHVDDGVTTDGQLDTEKLDAVGRLSANAYARLSDRFTMKRPP
jgi:flavin reductase (DIM6/NTAB) family NADH-FMN oxidoreductase RutF